ncbi:UNVERIFIED_CONTAM: hypothetical protein GTU68_001948, partial [Idotea baltica]|nr:hypothetical protein [Idotea baltica]
NPDLRGKPIAVGGGETRGVTTTASYEARKFGVRSAMTGYKAKQLCPDLIFVPPRFDVYHSVSLDIRAIFKEYTDLIEPLSLDEAFLDITTNKKNIEHGMDVAKEIMNRVEESTQLTCSAGVSYCKFLAKIASDYKKPNGLTVITPRRAIPFLEKLPIQKFFGVGKVTAAKMMSMGIHNGLDLKGFSKVDLAQAFGKRGRFYYDIVRGLDDRPVNPNRIRKSLAVERTMDSDMSTYQEIKPFLLEIIDKFYIRLNKKDNFGRTLTLKLKTGDFQTITRSLSKDYFIKDKEEISQLAISLLENNMDTFNSIRLIGLTASNLEKEQVDTIDPQLRFDWD